MNRLLIASAFVFTACTATVVSQPAHPVAPPPAGPPPAAPPPVAPPPAAPPPTGPVAVVPAPPMPPARHPAYLHALTDLRHARAFLERPANVVVKWDEKHAIGEIDGAIREIKAASIDDGKDLMDHPPVDIATWGGRLQRSLELLSKARADVGEEEDNPQVHNLRVGALRRIAAAENFVREGIEDARALKEPPPPPMGDKPGAHPAYLHALTDLRHARALLERPASPDVKWDENVSISQIDAAIKEIRDAAIDDGKPLSDHPPVDVKVKHRDRLRQAMELLRNAAKDVEEREDNNFAKGLRHRAVEHIRSAEHGVHEAMEERHDERVEKHHGH